MVQPWARAHDRAMNERSLERRHVQLSVPSIGGIAAAIVVAVIGLVIIAAVASTLLAFIGLAMPFLLLVVGALLVSASHPVIGIAAMAIGGLILLGDVPPVLIAAGGVAAGFVLARRSYSR